MSQRLTNLRPRAIQLMHREIGFMQGRLSPMVDDKIQAFPWAHWREEFQIAEACGFHLMEWTLDQERLFENPLMTKEGQSDIQKLCRRYHMCIQSLTGDCFMQAPFWKVAKGEREDLQKVFKTIISACSVVGIQLVVVPLVDNGRIVTPEQATCLVEFLSQMESFLKTHHVRVLFESDFNPTQLAGFINGLDSELFGINYDIGNSAALGFDVVEELNAYGNRVQNVHIKDRKRGGHTVPLGTGHADFKRVFSALKTIDYSGQYILQTARATDGKHAEALMHYRSMTENYLGVYES